MTQDQRIYTIKTIQKIENKEHFLAQNKLQEFYDYVLAYDYVYNGDRIYISLYSEFFLENGVNVLNYLSAVPENCFWRCHFADSKLVIPNNIKDIGDYAFCDTDIETLTIPDSVEVIYTGAFMGCDKLHTVHIDDRTEMCDEDGVIDPTIVFDDNRPIRFEIYNPDTLRQFYEYGSDQWEIVEI